MTKLTFLALAILMIACSTFEAIPDTPTLVSPEDKSKHEYVLGYAIELTFAVDVDCIINLVEVSTSPDFEPYYTTSGAGSLRPETTEDGKVLCIYPLTPFGNYESEPRITHYWRAYYCDQNGNWSEPSEVWTLTVKMQGQK